MLLFVGLLAGGVIASRNATREKKQSAVGVAKCVGSLSPRIDVSQLARHGGQPYDMWSLQGLRLQEFCSRSCGAGVNRDD